MKSTATAAALCAAMAGAAWAGAIGLSDSLVRMDRHEGCAAVITLLNSPHDLMGTYSGAVSLDGLDVQVELIIGPGAVRDTLTAHPPEGYIAIPPSIETTEDKWGEILICAIDGVGA